MGDPEAVIRVENLSKRYVISHAADRGRYSTLRDALANGAKSLGRRLLGREPSEDPRREEFWALKDVSFEVKRGEVVGIIGRNGAGKSTLLKVLSRITEPTSGRIEIDGRVASLLEVGTGFHPELTGRENIYLNGAILGMSRAEIKRKFDEIVAFAEIEKFLDTPVKRYSSGMYMRLAFAVAAHLESEIMVVDEVLAVGDATFQKKCLGRMGEVSASGRTVLFVSHNIGSLMSICHTGVLLDAGQLVSRGEIKSVVQKYYAKGEADEKGLAARAFHGPLRSVTFDSISLNGRRLGAYATASPADELVFLIEGRATADVPDFRTYFSLYFNGFRLLTLHDTPQPERLPRGSFEVTLTIPAFFLRPGEYALALGGKRVSGGDWLWATDLAVIEILPEWEGNYESEAIGVINLSGRGKRRVRHQSSEGAGSSSHQNIPRTANEDEAFSNCAFGESESGT